MKQEKSIESLLLTPRDVASMLGVSLTTVWRLKAIGQLPRTVHIGKSQRWKRSDIIEWLDTGCPSTIPSPPSFA
jgi:excisionase family DNA binding protein